MIREPCFDLSFERFELIQNFQEDRASRTHPFLRFPGHSDFKKRYYFQGTVTLKSVTRPGWLKNPLDLIRSTNAHLWCTEASEAFLTLQITKTSLGLRFGKSPTQPVPREIDIRQLFRRLCSARVLVTRRLSSSPLCASTRRASRAAKEAQGPRVTVILPASHAAS